MAAGLEHDQAAETIEVFPGEAALLQQGRALDRRIARGHDPDRLAAGMHLDGLDPGLGIRAALHGEPFACFACSGL
jgi:hypothetical protein